MSTPTSSYPLRSLCKLQRECSQEKDCSQEIKTRRPNEIKQELIETAKAMGRQKCYLQEKNEIWEKFNQELKDKADAAEKNRNKPITITDQQLEAAKSQLQISAGNPDEFIQSIIEKFANTNTSEEQEALDELNRKREEVSNLERSDKFLDEIIEEAKTKLDYQMKTVDTELAFVRELAESLGVALEVDGHEIAAT